MDEAEAAAPAASVTSAPKTTGSGSPTELEEGSDRQKGTPRRRRRGGKGRGGRGSGATKKAASAAGSERAGSVSQDQEPRSGDRPAAPRSRKKSPATDQPAPDRERGSEKANGSEDEGESPAGEAPSATKPKRRRRGGRGRGGRGSGATRRTAETGDASEVAELDVDEPPTAGAQTRLDEAQPDADAGSEPGPAAADERSEDQATTDGVPSKSRARRRRSRSRAPASGSAKSKPAAENAPKEEKAPATKAPATARRSKPIADEEAIEAGGSTRTLRSSRSRTGGAPTRRRREVVPVPPRVTDKLMVLTEHGERDQIAVLEGRDLVQHYVTRKGARSMVGNVYLGRVQNVLPGMEAAFVDVGRGRNGVLYAGEVNYSAEDLEGPAPRIEQVLKPGQAVMVQVTKDPMGGKGARLTANLSLPGRYLVLAPDQDLSGISRRVPDDERRRLKTILRKIKPSGHGVIVRTAAEDAPEEAISHDLERLLKQWDSIKKMEKKVKAPEVLYEEPELTVRVVRDLFTDEEFRGIVTDSERIHSEVGDYLQDVAPDLVDKLQLHTASLPAFEEYHIVEQIHKALDRKVWLPSGGYLIIERTEAMTIIDVNTGKSVGKTNLETTVVNTNLEAAREVARQLRLRDIGGIIVIDFIDMLLEKNKKKVEDTMREALAADKTRSQVFEIGPLGLMQVTRKRVSSGLVESFSETCPTCEGRGIILTYDVR